MNTIEAEFIIKKLAGRLPIITILTGTNRTYSYILELESLPIQAILIYELVGELTSAIRREVNLEEYTERTKNINEHHLCIDRSGDRD